MITLHHVSKLYTKRSIRILKKLKFVNFKHFKKEDISISIYFLPNVQENGVIRFDVKDLDRHKFVQIRRYKCSTYTGHLMYIVHVVVHTHATSCTLYM